MSSHSARVVFIHWGWSHTEGWSPKVYELGLGNVSKVQTCQHLKLHCHPNFNECTCAIVLSKIVVVFQKVDAMSLAAYVSFLNPAMLIPNRNNETRRLITYTLPKEVHKWSIYLI